MPDITMCSGNNCPSASICYRYKAEPSKYRQSYFVKPPNDGVICEYFWEMECEYCHQKNALHKMSCPTQKMQINL